MEMVAIQGGSERTHMVN